MREPYPPPVSARVRAAQTAGVRFIARVSPGSRRPGVGGRYGDGEPPVLVVRVGAPAADGKANQAVIRELAEALRVPVAAVRIVRGQSSRTKVVQVDDGDEALLDALLKTHGA